MSGSVPEVVTITLNINSANMVLNALAEQPWRIANDVILDIRSQLLKQINPQQNVTQFQPPNQQAS